MAFDFGQNWLEFSRNALTPERVRQAEADFARLLESVELRGRSFLDVGFGQGLALFAAARLGADPVVGCDVNPTCREAARQTAAHFSDVEAERVRYVVGSILEEATLAQLRALVADRGGHYDVVHSWGVLHHTGDMRRAIANCASLVRPGGTLVLALYNRHWSSPAWGQIKRLYCRSPRPVQRLMVRGLLPVIGVAKRAVAGPGAGAKDRGMDFYYDVVDWVGGYPYEYASQAETLALVEPHGFRCATFLPAQVPTGCHQYVFVKDEG
jgi:SAM-dependent methyltransferase